MKKEIKVVVFKDESCAYDLPDTPSEFLEWWSEKFELVPDKYKAGTRIDCEADAYYDSASFGVEIYYYRPETDEEENARAQREKQAREFRENQELCELERLLNKYSV